MVNKTIFKSEWGTNAKRLMQSTLGSNIDKNYVAIGNPEQIVTEDHLEFAKYLHETISELELKPPIKKKGETHSRIVAPKTNRASK